MHPQQGDFTIWAEEDFCLSGWLGWDRTLKTLRHQDKASRMFIEIIKLRPNYKFLNYICGLYFISIGQCCCRLYRYEEPL